MKTPIHLLLTALLILVSAVVRADYDPPTDKELDQLLANPKLINITIKDASGDEAAEVMLRLVDKLMEEDLTDVQLRYTVAYYSARIAFLLPEGDMPSFATALAKDTPRELLPTIMAGLSMGGGGINGFKDHLVKLAAEDKVLLQAIRSPRIPLTNPVYRLLVSALGTVQTLPPVVIDSLPPPIPVGRTEAPAATPTSTPVPQPVVPDTYDGQG